MSLQVLFSKGNFTVNKEILRTYLEMQQSLLEIKNTQWHHVGTMTPCMITIYCSKYGGVKPCCAECGKILSAGEQVFVWLRGDHKATLYFHLPCLKKLQEKEVAERQRCPRCGKPIELGQSVVSSKVFNLYKTSDIKRVHLYHMECVKDSHTAAMQKRILTLFRKTYGKITKVETQIQQQTSHKKSN